MSADADAPPPGWRVAGLDELFQLLRDAGLAIGPGEAIDATRVVRHCASTVPPGEQTREALWHHLRPTLCKAFADQPQFDEVFKRWSELSPGLAEGADGPSAPEEPLPARSGSAADQARETTRPTPSKPPPRWPLRDAAALLLITAMLLAGAWYWPKTGQPPAASPAAPAAPAAAAPAAPAVPAPPLRIADREVITIHGYFPAVRYSEQVRPAWLWALVLLVASGLAIVVFAVAPPLPFVSRSRGGGSVTLQPWPAVKELQHLMPRIAPAVEGQLQRHVRGAVEERRAYARRPLLDPRRTVEATLGRFGLPSPRYRYARLRPAYFVLVNAARDDDIGILWAERLRGLDVQVEIFRFDPEHDTVAGVPRCHEVGGAGRRLSLDALPKPAPGQRLVVIADPERFFGPDDKLLGWVRAARLGRWRERALFTPGEPRHWNLAQVDALERPHGSDPGTPVFPLDDNALAAWSASFARGFIPDYELTDAQLYPQSLREKAALFVATKDTDAAATPLGATPEAIGREVSRLVTQLQAYLGRNGFYWLCACAVPPLIDRPLALLLGEQYFLRCDTSEERIKLYMASNWRRLAQLPWLRDEQAQFPQWLRLALLARLPAPIQEELRDVVRGVLAVQDSGSGSGQRLGFDQPDSAGAGDAADGRHALYIGFVRDRLTAEALVLRLGAEWRWLPALMRRPPWWQRAGSRWSSLALRSGIAGSGPSRLATVAGMTLLALGLSGFGALWRLAPADTPASVRRAMFEEVAHGMGGMHKGPVRRAAYSPDGRRIVTASHDRTARIWDAATGAPVGEPLQHEASLNHAAFSPDGRRIVTASGDNTARVWDAATGAAVGEPLRHELDVYHAAFSPDGRRIVTASRDGTARIWDAAAGAAVGEPLRHELVVYHAAFSPDGRRIVTASWDNTARVWDAATGAAIGEPLRHDFFVNHAAFSPDGRRIVTASADGTARIWDAAAGAAVGEPLRHESDVFHAGFSPDGRRIVTASGDNTARVWDAATGAAVGEPLRHKDTVFHAGFSPDGRRIVTASDDRTARVWDAATGAAVGEPLRHKDTVFHAGFSPDGRRIVTASDDRIARVWDAAAGAAVGEPLRHDRDVDHAAFSPNGRRIVTASFDNTARVWDAATGVAVGEPLRHEATVTHAAFSPDGRRIVTASRDGTARVWDAAAGAAVGEPLRHEDVVSHAAFSPDGRRIVTASWDDTARVWDAATGAAVGEPLRHEATLTHAAFSPDGRRIVTASRDGTARVWDAAAGAAVGEPLRHEDVVSHAAFSPDGRRIVTASGDNTARVWDAATGAAVGEPLRHKASLNHAAFSPDGRRIVTASGDNTARIWDAATGAPLSAPLRHGGRVSHAAFSPDGRHIVTASFDGTARVWDAADGLLVDVPFQGVGPAVHAAWSPDGKRLVVASGNVATPPPTTPPPEQRQPTKKAPTSKESNALPTYGMPDLPLQSSRPAGFLPGIDLPEDQDAPLAAADADRTGAFAPAPGVRRLPGNAAYILRAPPATTPPLETASTARRVVASLSSSAAGLAMLIVAMTMLALWEAYRLAQGRPRMGVAFRHGLASLATTRVRKPGPRVAPAAR